jgi:hypothetical protein
MTPIELLTDHFNVRCIRIYDNPGGKKYMNSQHSNQHQPHPMEKSMSKAKTDRKNYSRILTLKQKKI